VLNATVCVEHYCDHKKLEGVIFNIYVFDENFKLMFKTRIRDQKQISRVGSKPSEPPSPPRNEVRAKFSKTQMISKCHT